MHRLVQFKSGDPGIGLDDLAGRLLRLAACHGVEADGPEAIVAAMVGLRRAARDAGDWTTFGDGLGAGDLEVGVDRIVYALAGSAIRRYDEAGVRIYPDLTAPHPMGDLTIGDYVFTPSGEGVLVVPAPDVEPSPSTVAASANAPDTAAIWWASGHSTIRPCPYMRPRARTRATQAPT